MNDEMDIEFYYVVLYVQSVRQSKIKRLKNDVARIPGIMVIYIFPFLGKIWVLLLSFKFKNCTVEKIQSCPSPHVRLQEMAPPVCPSLASR